MVLGVYRCSHSNAPSTTQSIKCNIQHSGCSLHDIVRLLKRTARFVLFRKASAASAEMEAKAKVRIHDSRFQLGESGVANLILDRMVLIKGSLQECIL